jgi:hypothetical protein
MTPKGIFVAVGVSHGGKVVITVVQAADRAGAK